MQVPPLEIKVSVHVEGYWQVCPVCKGRRVVPGNFYTGLPSTGKVPCQRCEATGTVAVPLTLGSSAHAV